MADRTRTRLLNALKSSGPQTAADLAERLNVTSVAVRQHLDGLRQDDLVAFDDIKGSVGRPKRIWDLTASGHRQFPDNHANLVVGLLGGLSDIYGPEGVEKLIAHREAQSRRAYSDALNGASDLADKVRILADLRSREGYMAEVVEDGKGYFLIENHCSICAAATACQAFCQSELSLFKDVLGPDAEVRRTEHQLSGDRRCAYRIDPQIQAIDFRSPSTKDH
ncbi:helix-turn-helix transcriptional regulator [Roseibium salinum]|uniref:Transcriptional regulator n=1 Tax=Roseibium salinum TaxID=1604349 RepID=A0ABT3R2N6_9HYPH|nr:metalloregulator ArsR/SmtB family transcription factor [Roseibium sp. DSM 29163]MCX2723463.1 transcriptional regulator [Roseibium sp. DSM 29163]MDN3718653.1 transcriptional regulator [Roseibium salinum]